MRFDILVFGILLLINPFYRFTDAAAAIICVVALRRGGIYLRDFKKAEKFSYALIAVGTLEFIFGFIVKEPDIFIKILDIWRYGLLIPIFDYMIRGIKDLALIGENKEILDRAERIRLPITISICLCLLLFILTEIFLWMTPILTVMKVAVLAITAMLLYVVFRCRAELNTYPGAIEDEEENKQIKS